MPVKKRKKNKNKVTLDNTMLSSINNARKQNGLEQDIEFEQNNVQKKQKNSGISSIGSKITIDGKEYDLSKDGNIEELQGYYNRSSQEKRSDIKSEVEKYLNVKINKHNLVESTSEDQKYFIEKNIFDKLFNGNVFEELKLVNKVSETTHAEEGLANAIKTLNNNKSKKIKDLKNYERSRFEEFFNLVESDSLKGTKLKEQFIKDAGIENKKGGQIKEYFFSNYTAAEGAKIIHGFINKYSNVLMNEKDIIEHNKTTIEDSTNEIEGNRKKIAEVVKQINNSSESDIKQIDQLFSLVEKAKEVDKKEHPVAYFFSKMFSFFGAGNNYMSKDTKQLKQALSSISSKILKDRMTINEQVTNTSNDLIKKQLSLANCSIANLDKKLSLNGISIDQNNNEPGKTKNEIKFNDEKILTEKDNSKISENMLKIMGIKEKKDNDFSQNINSKDFIITGNGITM